MSIQNSQNKATISDVARHAGVSIKSVSRVINNEPHVSQSLRNKVEQAIASLNYTPDMAARSLAGSRSFIIGVLFDNPSPSYTMHILDGAYEACLERKYHLRIDNLDSSVSPDELDRKLSEMFAHNRVDGLVLTPPLSDHAQILDFLEARGIRYSRVAPSSFPGRSPSVGMDDHAAGSRIAEMMWEAGHRRFGLLNGPVFHGASHTRRQGFVERLAQFDPAIVVAEAYGGFKFQQGIKAGLELLFPATRPTAVFATNDDSAAGLMVACSQLGLRVPGDLSICGFDDSWVACSVWPYLTTVRQPIREMGHAAAMMMLDRSTGDEPDRQMQHDFVLVKRETVGPPPASAKPATKPS